MDKAPLRTLKVSQWCGYKSNRDGMYTNLCAVLAQHENVEMSVLLVVNSWEYMFRCVLGTRTVTENIG